MNRKVYIILFVFLIVGLFWSYYSIGEGDGGRIVIFCGSASKPALEDVVEGFEEETGFRVDLNFSGSGTMLSQMMMSKSGDLYIPGSPDYMFKAIEENVVYADTIEKIAYLIPAIITPEGNPNEIKCLEDLKRSGVKVGIGDPGSVCIGEYAVDTLMNANLYEDVERNIVVYAESCSKTASLAVLGTVDAIIGWRVFHCWNPDKTDIVYIDPGQIPRIAYISAAISKYSEEISIAEEFINYLSSPVGMDFFLEYGYITSDNEAKKYAPNAIIPSLPGDS